MSKQFLRQAPEIRDSFCLQCKSMAETRAFKLCLQKASEYVADGKQDWHTCNHMRTIGECGIEARLFVNRNVKG